MEIQQSTKIPKFFEGISSGFVLTILLFFISFAISYGESKVFDGNLVGIFDL